MKILVDRNIRGAESTFGRHADLEFMDGRDIRKQHLAGMDALIIRTATRVDRTLLDGTSVGFVGTTSIGTDHLDVPYLEQAGIRWSNAPGCNADSAAEYTLAMAWLACQRLGRRLPGSRVGIIGRGNVGSRVDRLMTAMGAETVANDPPLADQGQTGLVTLEQALDRDIVCLHVPLTREGPYPTFRMIDRDSLARLPDGALLINSARGDVINEGALLDELKSGRIDAALDVWPNEPLLDPELLDRVTVATPHVAGYSDDGKRNGTRIVYQDFCTWSGLTAGEMTDDDPPRPPLSLPPGRKGVSAALEAACFVEYHDKALRALSSEPQASIAKGFDRLRKDYPHRRDFHEWNLACEDPGTSQLFKALGFGINTGS